MPRNGDERETDQHEQLVSAARLYYLQDKSQERMAKLRGVSGPTVSGLLEGESPN
jgi:DNA-binding transcriptional regulator LsrR (DeoR family)